MAQRASRVVSAPAHATHAAANGAQFFSEFNRRRRNAALALEAQPAAAYQRLWLMPINAEALLRGWDRMDGGARVRALTVRRTLPELYPALIKVGVLLETARWHVGKKGGAFARRGCNGAVGLYSNVADMCGVCAAICHLHTDIPS